MGVAGTTTIGGLSCSDNKNSTNYHLGIYGGNTQNVAIFWFVAPIGGSSFRVTVTGSYYGSICIDEFSFTSGATITNDASGATSASSSSVTGSALSIGNYDLVYSGIALAGSGSYTAGGTAITTTPTTYVPSQNYGCYGQYDLNKTTSVTETGTLSLSQAWAISSLALLATPAAPSFKPWIFKSDDC